MEHTGGARKGDRSLRYHLHLIWRDMDLKGVVSFAYGDSINRNVRNESQLLLCVMNPPCMSDEKEDSNGSVSRNTIAVEVVGVGEENSAMDVLCDYLVDAPAEEDYDREVHGLSLKLLSLLCFDNPVF